MRSQDGALGKYQVRAESSVRCEPSSAPSVRGRLTPSGATSSRWATQRVSVVVAVACTVRVIGPATSVEAGERRGRVSQRPALEALVVQVIADPPASLGGDEAIHPQASIAPGSDPLADPGPRN